MAGPGGMGRSGGVMGGLGGVGGPVGVRGGGGVDPLNGF